MAHLGIDIGSKTLKLLLLEDDGTELYSLYTRHHSRVHQALLEAIHSIVWRLGDVQADVTVTGSAGMRVAELFDIPFVQEVVALKRAVEHDYPQADAVLEMGGEDTKLVYLTGVPEQRMNNICAGGTGAFIDMMASLMGVRSTEMRRLALGYSTIYPIASRCAVFAKSDVKPLLNAGARKADIAVSVLDAVATQAVAGLSAGRPLTGTVLLLGGPFAYIPALRDSFCRVSGIDRSHAVVPPDAHLFVVRGAVYSPEKSPVMGMAAFEEALRRTAFENEQGIPRLEPLFRSKDEYADFHARHSSHKLPRVSMGEASRNVFLGVDAGSTTIKMALVDESGRLVDYDYTRNIGDVVDGLKEMFEEFYVRFQGAYMTERTMRGSCIIGYGEGLCRAAFGIDDGQVETVAHLRAAVEFEPQVDFLLDIGGQDIKCFYVNDGLIEDVVLNEACSSGCGSLFNSVARSFRQSKEMFDAAARFAEHPVDLGTRCTTFMDSRIKHAQKEGAAPEDIAAGVCYSIARNALFKVIRQPDFSSVGDHVVVQGGAFANDSLLRAFEKETGVQVVRPELAEVMGAWGAALLARDKWLRLRETDPQAAEATASSFLSRNQIANLQVKREAVRCDQCTNRCQLMVTRFTSAADGSGAGLRAGAGEGSGKGAGESAGEDAARERVFVTGNRCQRGAQALGVQEECTVAPPNMLAVKRALIASYDRKAAEPAAGPEAPTVGIPRALALYESYPFWSTFFRELGFAVVGSAESSGDVYRAGMGSIPAEGMCYPGKLLYGHCADAVERGAQVLFVPSLGTAFAREGLLGTAFDPALRTCPLVERMGSMVRDNAEGSAFAGMPMVSPDLSACPDLASAVPLLGAALREAGLACNDAQVKRAATAAQAEYRAFFERLARRSAQVLAAVDAGEYPGAVVSCHAYHADTGISHGIDELLGEIGYAVLEHVDYSFLDALEPSVQAEGGEPWAENALTLDLASAAAAHPNAQFIVLRSFGCGIDANVADQLGDTLRSQGRIYAELKIDQVMDLAAVKIRLRSLAYARLQRTGDIVLYPVERPGA